MISDKRWSLFWLISHFSQFQPIFIILFVHMQVMQSPFCCLHQIAWLKHERIVSFRYFKCFLLTRYEVFIRLCIWAVRSHARVKGRTARTESFSLGVILSADISHIFWHAISMVIWRFECIFCNQPPGWKNDKVQSRCPELFVMYPSIADLQVKTVNMLGSGWSKEIEPIVL